MSHEHMKVKNLPFDGDPMYPEYWNKPPNDWHAIIHPLYIAYGNGLRGSHIVYTSFNPKPQGENPPSPDSYGEIVVHDVGDDFSTTGRSITSGEIIARFGHYTFIKREMSGGAPEVPSWSEASDTAAGFAWGYAQGRDKHD